MVRGEPLALDMAEQLFLIRSEFQGWPEAAKIALGTPADCKQSTSGEV